MKTMGRPFRNYKSFLVSFSLFVVIFSAAVNFAAAQGYVFGKIFEESGVANWIKAVYLFGMGIIGVLAVMAIVFAGIQYISSVGNPEVIQQAKSKIGAAIAGLLLILLSYTILHTLDPRLVKLGFEGEESDLSSTYYDEIIEVSSCQTDSDCEKEKVNWCSEKKIANCENYLTYCLEESKKCGTRPKNLTGKAKVNQYCNTDADCDTRLCNTKENKCIIKPMKGYEGCERNNECESRMCRKGPGWEVKNVCVPIKGFPGGEYCDIDKHCESKRCVYTGVGVIINRHYACTVPGGGGRGDHCQEHNDCKENYFCVDRECTFAGKKVLK
jgi:hypothetical protein